MLLAELVNMLDDLFLPSQFSDACHNGLVIPGKDRVKQMLLGVSLNRALIDRAVHTKAEAVLVHHGVFISGNWSIPSSIRSWVESLIHHKISLFCYHLPMDAHLEFSHNRYLLDSLSVKDAEAFSPYGLIGDLPVSLDIDQVLKRLPAQKWGSDLPPFPINLPVSLQWDKGRWISRSGTDQIHRVAAASGRGGNDINAAAAAGAQLLITGEMSEHHPELASLLGINLIAVGHYLSEKGGLIRLGEWLKKVTCLDVSFFFEDNPL